MLDTIESISPSTYCEIVARIRARDPEGSKFLFDLISSGLRLFFARRVPAAATDLLHDVFLDIVDSIQRNGMLDPSRLMGYVRTIARRHLAGHIDGAVWSRREVEAGDTIPDSRPSPEETAEREERTRICLSVLRAMRPRDREILMRFYVQEQTKEQITREMGLSLTQFRLVKSRAKNSCAMRLRARLSARDARRPEARPG